MLLLWQPGYHGNCMFGDNLFHKQTGNLLTIKMIPCLLKLVDWLPRYNINFFPPWVTQSLMVYPQGKYGQGQYGISRVKGNPDTINTQKRISVEEHE